MKRIDTDGYVYHPTEDRSLVEFIVINDHVRESCYHPSLDDVESLCDNHGLPFDEVWDIINRRPRGVHTIIIDVEIFLEASKKRDKVSKIVEAILNDDDMPEHMVTLNDETQMKKLLERHLSKLQLADEGD